MLALATGSLLLTAAAVALLVPTTTLQRASSFGWRFVSTADHAPRTRLAALVGSGEFTRAARLLRELAVHGGDEASEAVRLALDDLAVKRFADALAKLETSVRRAPRLATDPDVRQALERLAYERALGSERWWVVVNLGDSAAEVLLPGAAEVVVGSDDPAAPPFELNGPVRLRSEAAVLLRALV